MACLDPDRADSGYATAAAAVICLGLAVTATALSAGATAELRRSRADLERTRAEYRLSSLQLRATIDLMKSNQPTRLAWSIADSGRDASVLAEPEGPKLGYTSADKLDAPMLARFGVKDTAALQRRLAALRDPDAPGPTPADLDAAPGWRVCAASLISPVGQATTATLSSAARRQAGRFSWRAGEVWRIRVVTADGWADDRVVRFTGSADHPAAIITRRFGRASPSGDTCAEMFGASARG